MKTNKHPDQHWTNVAPFPGRESITWGRRICIPQDGESMGIPNDHWARFFSAIGVPVSRVPNNGRELRRSLLDELFSAGEYKSLSEIVLSGMGDLLSATLSSADFRKTIDYRFSGKTAEVVYRLDGAKHNLNGPAVSQCSSGGVWQHHWYINNVLDNPNGPAQISHYECGGVCIESWWREGIQHNLDGMAQVGYTRDGAVMSGQYWIHGEELTADEFIKITSDRVALQTDINELTSAPGTVNI